MNVKRVILFAAFLAFCVDLAAQDTVTLVKPGDKAPDFTITMEDGTEKKLSELKGKVVWINFFATWCPPCRQELPHLEEEVYKKFRNNKDFEVLVIGREHDWATLNKFKKDNNFELPFYPDARRKAFSKYAKQNIPRNFIIDKEGVIVIASTGFNIAEFKEIIRKVEELL